MNTALLLSGGVGSRLQSEMPKQYICVNGKMLITYALETLSASEFIDEIQIVSAQEWRDAIISDAQKHKIRADKLKGFSSPGANRQISILSGMQGILQRKNNALNTDALGADAMSTYAINDCDTIFIHDAARPLLTQSQISDCFKALKDHDGVMPVLPMKDTVYLSEDGGTISKLLNRKKIFAGQAPELFNFKKYYQANIALTPDDIMKINGSTEPAILAGMDITMIAGDENNFKITTQADLDRFRNIIFTQSNNMLYNKKDNNNHNYLYL